MTSGTEEAYRALLPFPVAKARLQQELTKIEELEAVFGHLGIAEEIGMCLLHKHLEVDSDERLTRRFNSQGITIQPEKTSSQMPYIWALQKAGEEYTAIAVEFFMPNEYTPTLEIISAKVASSSYAEKIMVLGETLDQLDCLDLFGIGLLPTHAITPESHKTFLEREVGHRVLEIEMVPREMLLGLDTTKTLWKFPANTPLNTTSGSVFCAIHCATHCQGHCHHCDAHCGDH